MLRIDDEIAGEELQFNYVETRSDASEFCSFVRKNRKLLAIDTESTGINCYRVGWELRTVQCGNASTSYVVPSRLQKLIAWVMRQPVRWVGHNGPHDIRSIDQFLGYETGVICEETYIPAHHRDSRKQDEGGTGHGLKELSCALVDSNSGKWEAELKRVFKEIRIPIPGEQYKSGPRKGTPKFRKAKLSEGWALINPRDPAYIAYAAADTVLTFRLFNSLRDTVRGDSVSDLYRFDKNVQQACDRLQRRAIKLDIDYTERLSAAYLRKAQEMMAVAAEYGCANIHSGKQIADVLQYLGAELTARTPTGQWTTDDGVLRGLLVTAKEENHEVAEFIHAVLLAKQLLKRREAYTEAMLREMDSEGRVHPSINSLAARTTRMSVSNPALQQLPTKDREEDE